MDFNKAISFVSQAKQVTEDLTYEHRWVKSLLYRVLKNDFEDRVVLTDEFLDSLQFIVQEGKVEIVEWAGGPLQRAGALLGQ